MLAAENDVIPGAKVGGIADVVRDIPKALAQVGASVTVIIPAYNAFHRLPGSTLYKSLDVNFAGLTEKFELYELYINRNPGVRYMVLHNPKFGACGVGNVYCDDPSNRPFATDANKFALFCAAAMQVIKSGVIGQVDVMHLHDWHASFVAILREFDSQYERLKSVRCVFSIHNLAMQGIRPFADDVSSFDQWYPHLKYDANKIADPRWNNCVNPVAAAIRLSDVVHTVSPSYSREVLQPNAPERGFHGGEGLEFDLQQCAARKALVGIINGIEYDDQPAQRLQWHPMITTISNTMLKWQSESSAISTADSVAYLRTQQWLSENRPAHVFTSVGRLTNQKMALLLQPTRGDNTVLDDLLESLKGKGVYILLGSGDSELEALCEASASRHANFLFLNRYAQILADLLFANGDVFLMPSSFEPCGISQMLAMRHAQPCIVHAVGGLRDTIEDKVDGFQFSGDSVAQQVANLQTCMKEVIEMRERHQDQFDAITKAAQKKRFHWANSAQRYLRELYA